MEFQKNGNTRPKQKTIDEGEHVQLHKGAKRKRCKAINFMSAQKIIMQLP